jgi:RNA polymerase sigma-70 factor (ECF subfamily)
MAINEGTRNRWRRAVPISPEEGSSAETFLPVLLEDSRRDPAEQVHVKELQERVQAAVAELPERQRAALLLNRFEGLSYEDVAKVLDMKVPAVKSLLFRARENLKNLLAPVMREDGSHGLPSVSELDR